MAKPYQLNISPDAEVMERIDAAVKKYGKKHRNARNRAVIAAEIVELYFPAWLELMEAREILLTKHLAEGKDHAASTAPTRRMSRA